MKRGAMDRKRKLGGISKRALICVVCLAYCLLAPPHRAQAAEPKSVTLQGKLVNTPGPAPVLKTKDKVLPLSGRTDWLLHTLQDKRLADREIRVEGEWQPDGTLKVNHFFTLRNGKLFRVRYFCEICNIEALEPGDCVCCQQPTELQEIPVEGK